MSPRGSNLRWSSWLWNAYLGYGTLRTTYKTTLHDPKIETDREHWDRYASTSYNTEMLPYKGETRNALLGERMFCALMLPFITFFHFYSDVSALEVWMRNDDPNKYSDAVRKHPLFENTYRDVLDYVIR